jgi:hypothetical protein
LFSCTHIVNIFRIHYSTNYNYQVEEDEMGGACSKNYKKRNAYMVLVGMPEGKRPLGRPKHRWVDNIRIDVEGWDGVMWIGLVWLRIGTSGELL